jgi:hypothetical protein
MFYANIMYFIVILIFPFLKITIINFYLQKLVHMKKYLHTLYQSILLSPSVRISISYYSSTRTKSPKIFDKLYIRVGGSGVSIRTLQGIPPVATYRAILIALCLSPAFLRTSRLQKLSRGLANYLDLKAFDKQLKYLTCFHQHQHQNEP